MIWEKSYDVIVPILEEQMLMQERLPLDKENQELVTYITDQIPPTIEVGEHWEKKKMEEADESYIIEFEHTNSFEKYKWVDKKWTR